MEAAHFLSRALDEGRRYGDDPLVFLRELAQNARDARARRLDVEALETAAEQIILFTDDGCGMSFAHARRFFFRLYASSKEADVSAAGRFGVGFWSVLVWGP